MSRERVREAVRLAEEERPGAVHLELPEDVAAETVSLEPIVPKKIKSLIHDTCCMIRDHCVVVMMGAGDIIKYTPLLLA